MTSDLIARLEALIGPDRGLDLVIAQTLVPDVIVLRHDCETGQNLPHTYWEYTASLDAAVALVERCLPGWSWEARKSGFGNGQASVWNPMEQPRPGTTIRSDHKSSTAIALLLALFRALEAEGARDE